MSHHVTEYLETRQAFEVRRPLGAAAAGRWAPLAKLDAWQRRRRTIRDLEALDDRFLADIGLSRAQIGPWSTTCSMQASPGRRRPTKTAP
jgi:uncharacterized protein YjiS (DUF1127 family)